MWQGVRCCRPSPVAHRRTAGSAYVADFDAIFTDEVFADGTCSSSSSAVVVAMAHWPKALATGEATGRLGLAGLAGQLGRAAWLKDCFLVFNQVPDRLVSDFYFRLF